MKPIQFVFEAIGTRWVIDIENSSSESFVSLESKIQERIYILDSIFSRFREDSLVTKMSKNAGTYSVPSEFITLLSLYKELYDVSDGLVTPLVGSILEEAGYDASYSLIPKTIHDIPSWDDVISCDDTSVTLLREAVLDFGACGKGFIVDEISTLLRTNGIQSFCVDAGGDMFYQNSHNIPLRVGLEHPEETSSVVGVTQILNESICGSAGNRRAWGDYHHIMNPKTHSSPRHINAIWTTASSAVLADAMATALFFTDSACLENHFDYEYLMLYPDYTYKKSPNFNAELFVKNTIQ